MAVLNTMAKRCVNTPRALFVQWGATLANMHPATERLFKAAEEIGGLSMPSKVAFALGESQQTLKHWEKRGLSQRGIVRACELWGVSPAWLKDGVEPMRASDLSVAHSVSDLRPIVTIQKVTWEGLPLADLTGRFELALRDDALSPEYPTGTAIRFDAKRPPRPGWPVLVKDSAGAYYVRDYIEGAAGQWAATPRQRGYASLDSVAHGLQLVGVMYGADWP
jgi:hypothetical protein